MRPLLEADALARRPDDPLDLVERVFAAGDRQQRRRLGEIGGIDDGLDLGRDRDRLSVRVLGGDRHLVVAVGPLQAAGVLAVPHQGLAFACLERAGAGKDESGGYDVGRQHAHPAWPYEI